MSHYMTAEEEKDLKDYIEEQESNRQLLADPDYRGLPIELDEGFDHEWED